MYSEKKIGEKGIPTISYELFSKDGPLQAALFLLVDSWLFYEYVILP